MSAHTKASNVGLYRVGGAKTRGANMGGVLGLVERWSAVAAERRALAAADDAMLKDIGLSRADVVAEASRPFWDLPRAR